MLWINGKKQRVINSNKKGCGEMIHESRANVL